MEIEELDNEELVEEYKHTIEFRVEESLSGQVTPHEITRLEVLEEEILERLNE